MSSNRKMRVYKAKDGWRWQLWRSSDIVAESGGAYENRSDAVDMASSLIAIGGQPDAVLEVEDTEGGVTTYPPAGEIPNS